MSWEFGSHEVRHKVCCKIFISLICFCCFNCWQHFMWSHIFSNPKFLLICELGIWKTRGQTRGLLGFGQLASLPLQKYNVAPRKTHDETRDVRTVFKMLIFSMYPNFARGNTLILRNTLCYETQEDVQFWPSRSLGWYSIRELRFLIRRTSCQSPTWFADCISTSDQLSTFSILVDMISWSWAIICTSWAHFPFWWKWSAYL